MTIIERTESSLSTLISASTAVQQLLAAQVSRWLYPRAGAASADSDGERWDGKRRGRRGRDGGGGGKRSHMAKMDPGAPVAGALLRMDEWPPDCDIDGNPLPSAVRTPPRCSALASPPGLF